MQEELKYGSPVNGEIVGLEFDTDIDDSSIMRIAYYSGVRVGCGGVFIVDENEFRDMRKQLKHYHAEDKKINELFSQPISDEEKKSGREAIKSVLRNAEIDKLDHQLSLEKKCHSAAIYGIVQTVGGTDYEGNPTSEVNYLQRLRELIKKEQQLAERDFEIERLKDIFRDLLKYYVSNDAKEVIDVIKQAIGENGGE